MAPHAPILYGHPMIESWERDAPKLPSDRSIGILFAAVFAALGAVLGWRGAPDAPWMFVVAAVFGLLALLRPSLLAPLNRAWMRLAALLHRIVSPLVLGILYFAVLTPVAMVMRVTGRDALRRRFDPAADSYWIPRSPPGPTAESFRDQF